jgi:MFS family permease
MTVGLVSSKTGRYRWAVWIAWGMITFGFGILCMLGPQTSVAAFIFLNVPVAIGTGMAFTSSELAVQAAGRPQDAGHAMMFYAFIRVLGESVGVAIGGVIFQNEIRKKLSQNPTFAPVAVQYSKDATALVTIIKQMDPSIKKTQLIQTYSNSLRTIWIVMSVLSGIGFLISIFIKEYTLEQEHKTLQGFVGDQDEGEKSSS